MRSSQGYSVALDASTFRAFDSIIDTRSPGEFALDRVPGAMSCPVLDDAERARVGTLHKQASPFEARKVGAALVAKNIARHIETGFAERPRGWRPLVYCWRGGKRSAAMAHVLREVGWDAHTLEGGYRSYRRFVVERLAALPEALEFRVVHGVTGSGKSRLLQALRLEGAQVLDLEQLAAHRGSVLGGLPARPQPSQKMFESLLLAELAGLDPARAVYVEGESRKIGQLQVPEALMQKMRASACLALEAGRDTRIALLLDEYRHFFSEPALLEAQLECLTALHGRARVEEWKLLAARGAWPELVGRLLEEHYDPAYLRSAHRNFQHLPQAAVLRLEAPDPAAFTRLARGLLAGRMMAAEDESVHA